MKKLFSLLLALAMIFSLATVAFAVEKKTNGEDMENGQIVISGASANYTYSVYKLLHLDSYNNDNGAYTYKVESKWADFFKEDTGALDYVTIDASGYVSWVTDADAAAFAKLALAYAKEKKIDPEVTSATEGAFVIASGAGTFSNLTLGYYLVDTSMGALCGLSTTKPVANISVKNGVPTLDKSVEEDSNAGTGTNAWGSTNSADIGQTVNFDVTINAQAGADSYVFHDKMSKGLTLKSDTVVVKYHNPTTNDTRNLVADTEYTLVTTDLTDGCTFEVHFKQSFLNSINANDKLYVTYSATLNNEAVIGEDGNPNEAWLDYGDSHHTTKDTTTTYTYGFEIFKTDASMKPLTGAQFQLYDSSETTPEHLIDLVYNPTDKVYRRATKLLEGEEECNDTITVNDANGVVRIVGLDNGTYYLKETVAPDGYKLMTGTKSFIISGSNLYTATEDGTIAIGASVHVENNTGATLPETGAAGTMMFIMFGTFVVLSTGVLLVTKKRMSMIQD